MLVRTKAALAAASALLLVGAAAAAPTTSEFLAKAGASDLYERTASQLVAGSTKDAALRRFANQMVVDHGKSTAMVKQAATRAGLHPKPPVLDAKQQKMIADLRHATGKARDSLYIDQQRQAHSEALSLMQDYAATGETPALRDTAGKIVPVVQHHVEMLGQLH